MRKSVPKLTEEDKAPEKKKIDTLKAGMLAREAIALCGKLVEAHGPRISGSKACMDTADDLLSSLSQYCTESKGEEISIAGRASLLPWKLVGFVYPLVVLLLCLGLPVSASLCYGLFGFYALRELYWYKPLFEKHQKKTNAKNVYGVLDPEGEVRSTLIFGAHHDSARLWKFSKEDKRSYVRRITVPMGMLCLLALECLVQLVTEIFSGTLFKPNFPSPSLFLYLIVLCCGIPLVWRLRDVIGDEGSPGAGDNLLSGTLLVQLARYYDWKKKCGEPLKHTRLVFASFDGEECGIRGSRDFFEHHHFDGEVEMLNFDCIYQAKALKFLSQDVNGTQQLDQGLASGMVATARQMGYQASQGSIPFLGGGTDAASACRKGIPATTLISISLTDKQHGDVSHTREDTPDAIEEKAVEQAISIAIKWVAQHEQTPEQKPQPQAQENKSLQFSKKY